MSGGDDESSFAPFTGRRWPERPDEGQRQPRKVSAAPHLSASQTSSPRERGEERLPLAAAPFLGFARLLRRFGFRIAPEQVSAFMQAVTLLGPRSMEDISKAALATLAPSPDRRGEFEAHFCEYFFGEFDVRVDGENDQETVAKDDSGTHEEPVESLSREESGELASTGEQLGVRAFKERADPLARFGRELAEALPARRSFRTVRTNARGKPDLRRSMRAIVAADGDMPTLELRRRQHVPRPLLMLIDISGSMKAHTADYLGIAHAAVQGTGRAEVFTFGTRLTRITPSLRIRNRDLALQRAAALVDDWDGGTRIGPALLAFLSVPRFAAFARGAAIVVLSDGLERGDHAEMETAFRRLGARAHRLSLCTPLAGDPRFSPETAALTAILPLLDDLVDGSSIGRVTDFILSLARPAPAAETVWRRVS